MENLIINSTDETPQVNLDFGNGLLEFSGKSLPEDVSSFYDPVLSWIDGYTSAPKAKTIVSFKLNYFNTASSKLILDILFKFESFHQSGNEVVIQWYYQEDDEDMEEAGNEYSGLVLIPFEVQAMT